MFSGQGRIYLCGTYAFLTVEGYHVCLFLWTSPICILWNVYLWALWGKQIHNLEFEVYTSSLPSLFFVPEVTCLWDSSLSFQYWAENHGFRSVVLSFVTQTPPQPCTYVLSQVIFLLATFVSLQNGYGLSPAMAAILWRGKPHPSSYFVSVPMTSPKFQKCFLALVCCHNQD